MVAYVKMYFCLGSRTSSALEHWILYYNMETNFMRTLDILTWETIVEWL